MTRIVSQFLRIGLLVAGFIGSPVVAQLPSIKLSEGKVEAPKEETPEDRRKRLKSWLDDWRAQVDALDKGVAPPAGITAEEVGARRSDLLLGIFTAENSIRSLDTAEILKQSIEQAKESNAKWKGFDKPGPYSFVIHDELRRQQEGIATRMRAYDSAVNMFERELVKRQDEIKKADEAVRRDQEAADRAAPENVDAELWRVEASKLKLRALSSAAAMLQHTAENTRMRTAAAEEEAALLKRKVQALGTDTAFPEKDLEHLKHSTEERRKDISKELGGIEKMQQAAISERQSALATVESLKAATANPTDADKAKLAAALGRVELLDNQLESMANRVEITGARLRFLSEYLDAQTARKTLLTSQSAAERTEALAALQTQLARASAFDSLVDVRRNAALSAMQEQEAKLAALPADSPQRPQIEQFLTTLRGDLDAVERFGQDISGLHLDIGRWLADSEQVAQTRSLGERLSGVGSRISTHAKAVWNFVVYRYDDKTEVDGQVTTVRRGLTLGWLIGALLFFWLAYRAGSWLLKRGFKRLVSKGRVEEGQADTLRRWTRIAMGIVLALVTLNFLKIPLTAFAFLGGALAIGIGFGTQTLFKNFISGLIVLAERKVRVGDILEVDGVAGTVTTIDTRSSTVRSFDGVDMIVPNSVLLENKVVNWTHDTAVVRRVVRVRVSYGSQLRMVSTILAECAAEHGVILKNPDPQVVLEDFAADSLVFAIFFWINLRAKPGGATVASDLRFMIERRLGEAGIALATPQQTFQLSAEKPLRVQMDGGDGGQAEEQKPSSDALGQAKAQP